MNPGEPSASLDTKTLLSVIGAVLKELTGSNYHRNVIGKSLARIAELVGASRLYLVGLEAGEGGEWYASLLYGYADPAVPPLPRSSVTRFPLRASGLGRWIDAFEKGLKIEGKISEFPESERALIEPCLTHSILLIPVYVEQQLWGVIGTDGCYGREPFGEEARMVMELFANAFAGGIALDDRRKESVREHQRLMQFFELVENTPTEIHVFDPRTQRFVYMNQTALKRLGYTEAEYRDYGPGDIVYGVDVGEESRGIIASIEAGNANAIMRTRQRRRDGSSYPVETRFGRITFDGRDLLVAMVHDISDRQEAEAAYIGQKRLFEDLFRNSSDAAMILENGRFIDVNEAALKMFGFEHHELLSATPSRLSPAYQPDGSNSEERIREVWALCIKEGNCQVEWVHLRADGTPFWVDVVLTRLYNMERDLVYAVLRDITQRKEYETMIMTQQNQLAAVNDVLNRRFEEEAKLRRELEYYQDELEAQVAAEVEKNREKDRLLHNQSKSVQMGEMLSMIAHQWRQPLNAISASAIAVAMKQDLEMLTPEAIVEHTAFIQEQAAQMSKTINDFMNFFKPEHQKEPFGIREMMQEVMSLMGAQLRSRGIALEYDAENPLLINGYRKELSHVLINLIANARDAYETVSGGTRTITVGIAESDSGWQISVEDHAGGIPQSCAEKIFNPYFTTKEQGKGTGIGLYMSRRIVQEVFGGTIDYENTADGSRFTIVIPR